VGLIQGEVKVGTEALTQRELRIDAWRYTGSSDAPVEIEGRLELGDEATGRFTLRPDCSAKMNASSGQMLCGGNNARNMERFRFPSKALRDFGAGPSVNVCPAPILEEFLGPVPALDAAGLSYSAGSRVEVDGARTSLSCTTTTEGDDAICGAERAGIEADGCTWDAFAIANPARIPAGGGNDGHQVHVWVGAVARPGCARPTPFCNVDFLFF
jgi:hypothetical protein